ncbi:hypothetical protein [Actinosynnema mirum]|uniref:CHAT domain-containing protein n=1 Tax=Actinosynnema mirum (strain ATCC 29888 / DSM 43827 / JCM 3225 / NBRC 14064 / NCIMB 13271 / NRRL B-12336 / IMRU 3971 / 101) TaxID=446462 RepID=C6WMS9_ACTMD|nr:hypothetical protein [Actinosynnema mirum]ACU36608.1 hypothetical protein Amir_2673 [Actinosynnema mirum DSM 43827]
MGERDRALDFLSAVVRDALDLEFTDELLERRTRLAARRLRRLAEPDLLGDREARRVLGLYHWLRAEARRSRRELRKAVALLLPVARDAPETLPTSVLDLLARLGVQRQRPVRRPAPPPLSEPVANARDQAGTFAAESAALLEAFTASGSGQTLAKAVELSRAALASTPREDPRRAVIATAHSTALRMLHAVTGDPALLREAAGAARAGVASAGDTAESARALTALHAALGALFEATGDLTPLRESARAARSALEVAPEGPDRVAALAGAAERQRVLAELTGDVGALAEAEGNARAALELGAADDPDLLAGLADALRARFAATGDLEALREAVDLDHDAVASTPDGHVRLPGRMINYVTSRRLLAVRTGDPELLRAATDDGRLAAERAPDHLQRGVALAQAGSALMVLADWSGDTALLREAAALCRESARVAPERHRAESWALLCAALTGLHERTGDARALGEAVAAGREAVAATPEWHVRHTSRAGALAVALDRVHALPEDERVLAQAVPGSGGVPAVGDGAGDRGAVGDGLGRSWVLSALGGARFADFQRSGDLEALAESVDSLRRALVEPADELSAARSRYRFGVAALALAARADAPELLVEALEALEDTGSAAPPTRFAAAVVAAGARVALGQSERALELVEGAVGQLPLLAALDLAREDAAAQAVGHGGFAAVAGAAALACGRPERAVELVQLVGDALVGAEAPPVVPGPVAHVFCGPTGGRALLVRPGRAVVALVLPGVAHAELVARGEALAAAVEGEDTESQRAVEVVLAWLWTAVARPVLDALGPHGRELPRLWWRPVGGLARLPLHAAGVPGGESALDRVVSSYVPAGRAGGVGWVVGALWPVDAVVATEVVESAHRAAAVAGAAGAPAASEAAARAVHAVVREHRAAYPDLPLRWAGHVHTGW